MTNPGGRPTARISQDTAHSEAPPGGPHTLPHSVTNTPAPITPLLGEVRSVTNTPVPITPLLGEVRSVAEVLTEGENLGPSRGFGNCRNPPFRLVEL